MIIAALGGLLASALSGIVGNRADAAVKSVWKAIVENLKKGETLVNYDLQRTVQRSYTLAIKSICEECLSEMKTKKRHSKDINWLENEQRSLDEELKKIEKAEYIEPYLESLREVEMLLTPEGELVMDRLQKVKSKLIQVAMRDSENGEIPECYKEKVEETLFERICGYFAFEIKHNQNVRNIFEGQLLSKIDVELEGHRVTIDRIEAQLRDQAMVVPQVLENLNKIDAAIQEVGGRVDIGFKRILGTVTPSAKGIEEIQGHLTEMLRREKQQIALQKSLAFHIGFNMAGTSFFNYAHKHSIAFFSNQQLVKETLELCSIETRSLAKPLNIDVPTISLTTADQFINTIGEQFKGKPNIIREAYLAGREVGFGLFYGGYVAAMTNPDQESLRVDMLSNARDCLSRSVRHLSEAELPPDIIDGCDTLLHLVESLVEEPIEKLDKLQKYENERGNIIDKIVKRIESDTI